MQALQKEPEKYELEGVKSWIREAKKKGHTL